MPEAVNVAVVAAAARRPRLAAALLFAAMVGALLTYEITMLFVRQTGVPIAQRGERPNLVGEVVGPVTVAQTFGVDAAGLSAITLEARPFHTQVRGDVVFTLSEVHKSPDQSTVIVHPGDTPVREVFRVAKPAADVVSAPTFRLEFPPVEDSNGKSYLLTIQAPAVPPGDGIGLWATRDQAYPGGVLTIDGKEQWGDLVFRGEATRATLFKRVEFMLRDRPWWLRSRLTLGAAFLLYNWALAAFTWYMLFVETDRATENASTVVPGDRHP